MRPGASRDYSHFPWWEQGWVGFFVEGFTLPPPEASHTDKSAFPSLPPSAGRLDPQQTFSLISVELISPQRILWYSRRGSYIMIGVSGPTHIHAVAHVTRFCPCNDIPLWMC